MRLLSDVLERGRSLLFRRREERELTEELALHVDLEAERLEREQHLSPSEARRRAGLALGGVDQISERVRDARGTRALDDFLQDLRYALRQLRREPGFAALAVLTLAVGIAANATMFGIVDRLLLRPPSGVGDPDRVARLYFRERDPFTGQQVFEGPTSYPMLDVLARVRAFSALGGYAVMDATLGQGSGARSVQLALVSPEYFAAAGVRAALGRLLGPADDRAPVVVLSHRFWQSTLAGDRAVLGRGLRVDGRPVTIVGVAEPGFRGLDDQPVDLWGPAKALAHAMGRGGWDNRGSFMWPAFARLRPGVAPALAAAQATATYRAELQSWGNPMGRDTVGVVELASIIAARGPTGLPRAARISLWLEGVAAVVLLVACANIGSLLLARALRRRREIAMRLALGAGRGRLVRQLLTEMLVLALLAGVAALVVTVVGGRVVRALLLARMGVAGTGLDARMLAFTAGATLLVACLAGLAPTLRALPPAVADALKAGVREGGPRRWGLQRALLLAQTTLSVVLLAGAGLFVHSLRRVRDRDVGITLPRVLRVQMPLREAGFDSVRILETYRGAYERVRHIGGVENAALVAGSSPMGWIFGGSATLPGGRGPAQSPRGGVYYSFVDPGFFGTLGAHLLQGRGLTADDERAGTRVVVVNERLARHLWPGGGGIGQCVIVNDEGCRDVVGIIQDVLTFRVVGDDRALFYLPRTDPLARGAEPGALLVRVAAGAPVPSVAAAVRRDLQSLAPDMPFVDVQAYADLIAPELEPWRLGATMFSLFGALALAIAAIGLFSVLAYAVAQRTHEIGVRVALGAARGDVMRMVVLDGVRLVGYGLALGVLVALAAGRFVAPLLYDTSPRDPRVFAAVVAVLLAAALVASLLPARRAAGVDPARALAAE